VPIYDIMYVPTQTTCVLFNYFRWLILRYCLCFDYKKVVVRRARISQYSLIFYFCLLRSVHYTYTYLHFIITILCLCFLIYYLHIYIHLSIFIHIISKQ